MTEKILVLVIENEATIMMTLEDALDEAGFAVLAASSGRKALDALEADGAAIRCVLTDIDLGRGPDGWEIARRAREVNAAMPIVYMTGASAEDWTARGVPTSVLVKKPFAPAQIVTAVSNAINDGDLKT